VGAARVDVSRPGTAPAPAPFWGSSQKPEWKKLMELDETGQGGLYDMPLQRFASAIIGGYCRPMSHVPIIIGGHHILCGDGTRTWTAVERPLRHVTENIFKGLYSEQRLDRRT